MSILSGIHPVGEALRSNHPLDRVLVAQGAGGPRLQEIVELCRRRNIVVRFEPREALDRVAASAAHQGVVALGAAHAYADYETSIAAAQLIVLLDGVEDPHNLGAVIRSAHAAGAKAILIPERRAAGLTETVAKAAAGAMEHIAVARIGNVSQTLEDLKKRGFWVYGLDERGESLYSEVDYARPTVLVLGGEGHGMHQQVRKHCDAVVRIPMTGAISSLNVSVAAGIVLFEWRRRNPLGKS